MHETYSSKGLIVLGINVKDSESDAGGYAKRLKFTFPILLDIDGRLIFGHGTSSFLLY
jgi:hypothetical protein